MNQALFTMGVNRNPVFNKLKLKPGPSIVNTWLNSDGHFGFLEFRSPEEAS